MADPASLRVGDLVASKAHPDRVGEIISITNLETGVVSVRWRLPSGVMSRVVVDEPVDGLVRLPRSPQGREKT